MVDIKRKRVVVGHFQVIPDFRVYFNGNQRWDWSLLRVRTYFKSVVLEGEVAVGRCLEETTVEHY